MRSGNLKHVFNAHSSRHRSWQTQHLPFGSSCLFQRPSHGLNDLADGGAPGYPNGDERCGAEPFGNLTTVGSATSRSFYGAFDMGGNVWEFLHQYARHLATAGEVEKAKQAVG